MSAQAGWASVIDDVDDVTARLILNLQLDDIKEIQANSLVSADSDEQNAFRRYQAELQHHQALRNTEPEASDTTEPTDPTPHAVPPPTVPTFQCVACNERFDVDHAWQAPCSHWYCDHDLARLFRESMIDQSLYPPRCCRQNIPFDDIRHFLGAELTTEFADKQEELGAAKSNAGTYCYVSQCSAFIGDDHKDGSIGTCPWCFEQTCVLCKLKAHEGDCQQDEAIRQTDELAQQQGWRRCPGCSRWIELSLGCNHMTCPCSAQSCYVCGARWKTCGCPQFEERNLIVRAEEIGQREGRRDVAAVAEGLRENHDCQGNHRWNYVRGANRCDECTHRLPTFIFRCGTCRMQVCRRCRDNRL